MPFWDVHFKPGFNLVRLVTKRQIDVTNEASNSVQVTLQKQLEDVVGKIILANSEGVELPLIETLRAGLSIKNNVMVISNTVSCPPLPIEIPGIAPADAFDADDCFGTIFRIAVPKRGEIRSATFWDMDDEGSQIDLFIFKENIPQIASDAGWAPTDEAMWPFVTLLQFATFTDSGTSRIAELVNIGKGYTAPDGYLYIQSVCRGTPNIAQAHMPRVQIQILSSDPEFKE